MGTGKFDAGNHVMQQHPIQGRVEMHIVSSFHRNRDKCQPDGPLNTYADLTLI